MFLTAILRTGTKNDYLFRFLVPRRDGRPAHALVQGGERFSHPRIAGKALPTIWGCRSIYLGILGPHPLIVDFLLTNNMGV